jgi:hypothetical protein
MLKVILLKAQSLLLKVKNAQSHFAQSSKSESWPSGFYAGLLKKLFKGNRYFLFNNHVRHTFSDFPARCRYDTVYDITVHGDTGGQPSPSGV